MLSHMKLMKILNFELEEKEGVEGFLLVLFCVTDV